MHLIRNNNTLVISHAAGVDRKMPNSQTDLDYEKFQLLLEGTLERNQIFCYLPCCFWVHRTFCVGLCLKTAEQSEKVAKGEDFEQ